MLFLRSSVCMYVCLFTSALISKKLLRLISMTVISAAKYRPNNNVDPNYDYDFKMLIIGTKVIFTTTRIKCH